MSSMSMRVLVALFVSTVWCGAARGDRDSAIADLTAGIAEGDAGTAGTLRYYLQGLIDATPTSAADPTYRETEAQTSTTEPCGRGFVTFMQGELTSLNYFTVSIESWENKPDDGGVLRKGCNVVAEKIGNAPLNERKLYIYIAHFDTQRNTTPPNGTVGADDDGSGVAALLVAARAVANAGFAPPHTIRFVVSDGEEDGLLGADVHAQGVVDGGENLAAVLNFDMAGHYFEPNDPRGSHPYLVTLYEDCQSLWLTDFADEVSELYAAEIRGSYAAGLRIEREFDTQAGQPHPAGDTLPFWERGFSGIWFHEYDRNFEVYHTPNDTIANMKLDYATKVARLAAATLAELADHGLGERAVIAEISGTVEGVFFDGWMDEARRAPNTWDQYVICGELPDTLPWPVIPPIYHTTGYYEPRLGLPLGSSGTTTITVGGFGTLVDAWSVPADGSAGFVHSFTDNVTIPSGYDLGSVTPTLRKFVRMRWESGTATGDGWVRAVKLDGQPITIPLSFSIVYSGSPSVPLPAEFAGNTTIVSTGSGRFLGSWEPFMAGIPALSAWGLAALAMAILVAGGLVIRREPQRAKP